MLPNPTSAFICPQSLASGSCMGTSARISVKTQGNALSGKTVEFRVFHLVRTVKLGGCTQPIATRTGSCTRQRKIARSDSRWILLQREPGTRACATPSALPLLDSRSHRVWTRGIAITFYGHRLMLASLRGVLLEITSTKLSTHSASRHASTSHWLQYTVTGGNIYNSSPGL